MPVMSGEELKAEACRFVEEFYHKRHTAIVYEHLTPNYVDHMAQPPITPDREGFIQEATALLTAFPDLQFIVDDMLVEGDKTVMRWTIRGTHEGDFYGIPPTHKQVAFSGVVIARWVVSTTHEGIEGKAVVEQWNFVDRLGLLQQLGVFPQPAVTPQPIASEPEVLA